MAKRKQEEAPKGSPAWMSTFSDLMNLLLCFFVLLFSMSTVDADKFQQFCDSNREIIDGRRLYVRTASKSLAIRKYIDPIDFLGSFEEQIERIDDAFIKAKELQELISHLVWK